MKTLKITLLAIALTILTGCVGTKLQVQQSYSFNQSDSFSYEIIDNAKVSAEGMNIFKSQLDKQLSQLDLASKDANKIINITFTHYYMRHGAARALVGLMAGADNITSTVTIKDKSTGSIVGEFQVVSKNPTATGSAKSLIQQHADKILLYVKSGKS